MVGHPWGRLWPGDSRAAGAACTGSAWKGSSPSLLGPFTFKVLSRPLEELGTGDPTKATERNSVGPDRKWVEGVEMW